MTKRKLGSKIHASLHLCSLYLWLICLLELCPVELDLCCSDNYCLVITLIIVLELALFDLKIEKPAMDSFCLQNPHD